MRYEDNSQAGGIAQGQAPDARDDNDQLTAGSRDPAVGNVITGDGTRFGPMSSDLADGAHITKVAGAGGTDSTLSGGKLQVAGEHGQLTIDADGNYRYVPKGNVPENSKDVFTYTLADAQGRVDTADLIIEFGKTQQAVRADAQQVVPGPDGVVVLPEGVQLSDIMVVGRNLVINLPDGTQMVIVDGAVFVPQLVLGGVEVPPTNLATLLIDSEPTPGVGGPPPSSGGNFEVPVPPLDPGVPLGDLIPPTELSYTPPEIREVGGDLDRDPTISIDPGDGVPVINAVDQVDEAGLPTRNEGEPAGTGEAADGNGADNDDPSEATTGTILYDSPDGVGSITINGTVVTNVGQVIQGQYGTMVITSIAPGAIGYNYILGDNTSGDATHDDFIVTITDSDGDQATATLQVNIVDDTPIAANDTDSIAAGEFGPATGNVITDADAGDAGDSDNGADNVGADDASVTAVSGAGGSDNTPTGEGGELTVNGQYGVLTIYADGSYSYLRNEGTPGGVSDVFTYTLTDGDGDNASATLTITIDDATPITGENATALLDDDALANGNPGGTGDDVDAANLSGTLAGSGGDGSLTWSFQTGGAPSGFTYQVQANGDLWVLQGGTHVLTVTLDSATGAYEVSQVAPIDHAAGGDENNLDFTITYRVTDVDGDSAAGTLHINVDDDTPEIDPVLDREASIVVDESGPTSAAAIVTPGVTKGDDPNVTGSGAIGSANSGTAIVDLNASFGADGPAAGGGISYALNVTNANSGLTLTDGSPIQLVELGNGVVVGVVQGGAFDGQAAFAISIDPSTGVVSVEQYLSLDHPVNPNPNDPLGLGEGTLAVVGTATDGDGDTVSTGDLDISNLITFLDDGPSINPALNANATVTVDESLPSGTPGIDTGAIVKGDDPDLAGGLALGQANSGSAIVNANAVFGADGPAAGGGISYALSITSSDPGLTLTDGTPIELQMVNGVIVGVVQGGDFDGQAAFAIAIDPTTGVVTVEQYLSLDHPVNPNPNDPLHIGEGAVGVTVTATDGDGDPVTSDAIDISGQITFLDDGPTVNPTVNAQATVTVDETLPSNTPGIDTGAIVKGDDPDLAGGLAIGQANSGAAIVDANAMFGADGPAARGGLSYNLSIINANSGLTLTDGTPISLQMVNGVIVGVVQGGSFDGQAAFAIAINSSTGVVTVEQYLSLDHPLNPNPNDPLGFGSNIIGVTVTATDGDGDPVTSAAVDIGGQITFLDDGPSANNDSDITDPLTDQASGNVITGSGTTEGTGNADNAGADGFGSITNLVGYNGSTDSNPSGGFDVNGQYGTLHMNADGSYTYTRTGGPGGAVETFVYTYVDGDGDPASATLTITIADNTPTLNDPALIRLDDDVIPGANGNVDGPSDDDPDTVGQNVVNGQLVGSGGDGDLDYRFTGVNSLPSGFSIGAGSDADTLLIVQDQNGSPVVVMTVQLNLETGDFSVTQNAPIWHPADNGGPEDNIENNTLVSIGVEVVDIDGDTDPASININIDDDTPTINVTKGDDSNINLTTDDSQTIGGASDTATSTANFSGVFGLTQSAGADGTNAAAVLAYALDVTGYTGGPGGVNSGLESHDADIFLYEIGGKVVGSTSATLAGVNAGNTIFDVAVNGSGVVTLTQYQQIDHDTADPTPTGSPYADHVVSLVDSLVTLTASASLTDKDGDTVTDSETVNIGANLSFTDDGPQAAIAITGATASVDETNGNQGDSNDVTGPLAVFNGVANKGTDADMAGPQFGTSAGAIVTSAGSSYDADGAGTTVFGLNVAPGGVDSGLDTTAGVNIYLFLENGIVVGRVGATALAAASGPAAFAIAIDPSTGVVSMVEYMSINHSNTGSFDESASILNTAIQATVTVTDFDGDTATSSVNIGSQIQFQDDGPTAAVSTNGFSLSHDETVGLQGDANDVAGPLAAFAGVTNVGDDPDVGGSNPLGYAISTGAIGSTGSSYGADGAGTTVFSLNVSAAGVDSGLNTTSGQDILLYKEGNLIVGRVSGGPDDGKAAFALAIDPSTGQVSMVQYLSIQHSNTGSFDESASIANGAVLATVTVTDGDNDVTSTSTGIGSLISFQDDGPSAAISVTNAAISIDESAGNQVDSNDVTGPIAAFAGVANPGDDPHVAGAVIQYAQKVGAVSAAGSSAGVDGGTIAYSLIVSSNGADSGLNTTDGHDILLYKEGNLIVGRVSGGADDGKAAFAIAIDPANGTLSMVEYLSIQHPNTGNPDDSVSIINGAISAQVTVTDGDGDSTSTSAAIGNLISFQDSGPVMTAAQNMNIQNSGDVAHTAAFAFNLGADGANTSNDVITNVVGSATVGGVAVQNWTLTPGAENGTTATYTFDFDYPVGGGATAHATGTLVFDKVAGTYTIDLDSPIQGVTTILQTATGTLFQGYEFGTSTTDNSQPAISVTQIQDQAGTANDIYVQFTGVSEPSSGTGDNNLEFYNWTPGSDNPAVVNGGGDTTWNAGQLFNQADSWVSTSNDSNGVAGDTIQGGEVLDFTLVQGANPTGTLANPANYAQASSMFLKFDGIGSGEDMIVVLKLYDPNTNTYTTRAVMIQNSDILKGPGTGPGIYSGITLDQNDGLVIIESNDYNLPGENWVIVGAQIAGSDEGLTGTAINLNGAIGANGDSITNGAFDTQSFATDTNDGPFKISSIGFTTVSTTPQNAQLDFDVTVTDGDGDSITQHVTATVTSAADATSAATIPAANTTVAPVALDLNGDGVHFLSQDAGVRYDYGNGQVATGWVAPEDGLLVRDANGNGTVDGASEFVFGSNGVTDLQALRLVYGDVLDANDADYAKFGVWQDANSNGTVDAGEFKSLAEAGITAISLVSDGVSYSAADGDVQVAGSGTYTNADGSTGSLADAGFLTGSATLEQQRQVSGDNSLAIAAAVAAAGLAALPAAAQAVDHANQHANDAIAQATASVKGQPATEHSDVGNTGIVGPDDEDHAAAVSGVRSGGHVSDHPSLANGGLDGGNAGHEAAVSSLNADDAGPSADVAAAVMAAPAINIPSAEALVAAGLAGKAHAPEAVANIIADALGGHAAPTVDGLLAGLAAGGHGPAESGLAAAASHGAGAVQGWDMGADMAFAVHTDMVMKASALALHHDAVQPTVNG